MPEKGRNVWRYVHSLPNPWEGAKRPGCLRWSTFSHGWPTYTSHGARDYCDDIFSGWLPSYTLTLNFNRLTVEFFPQIFQLLTFHHLFRVVVANLKGGINLDQQKKHVICNCKMFIGRNPAPADMANILLFTVGGEVSQDGQWVVWTITIMPNQPTPAERTPQEIEV